VPHIVGGRIRELVGDPGHPPRRVAAVDGVGMVRGRAGHPAKGGSGRAIGIVIEGCEIGGTRSGAVAILGDADWAAQLVMEQAEPWSSPRT